MNTERRPRAGIRVHDLNVRYPNGAHVVRGIDFAVDGGETVALVGESGSGKTTIAHAVLGLLPTKTRVTGRVVLHDDVELDLLHLSPRRWRTIRGRRIGYVGQNPFASCDPLRSVGHHVASAWTVHGLHPAPGAVTRALTNLGITDAEQRARLHPHQWSGGMLQRASIAGAGALDPDLIIADEPTSALDADLARSTLKLLRDAGAATLLVTHDLSLAEEIADTIIVLYGGEVMETGAVDEVMKRPRHPYTQALLAAIPRARKVLPTPLAGSPPDPRRQRAGCAFLDRCPNATVRCSERPIVVNGVACHEAPR